MAAADSSMPLEVSFCFSCPRFKNWLDYKSSNVQQEQAMGMPVRIDDALYEDAKTYAKAECRSIAGQIEFWAKVGKAALDNPDLPVDFVRDLLIARAEGRAAATPFVPEGSRS